MPFRRLLLLTLAASCRGTDLAVSHELDAFPEARCLDGSVARYYIRAGKSSNQFYIHQEGGGFCTSLSDCAARSRTNLGSTSPNVSDPWLAHLNLSAQQPVFSTSPTLNPLLHNWTHVYLVYCDGAYFAGNNRSRIVAPDGTRLHFAGKAILDAALQELSEKHGMSSATDVVLGGCSAGGIATYAHLDYVAARLRAGLAPHARLVGFPDSGFYADVPFFTDKKRFPFIAQNASATLSARCLSDHSDAPHKCLVAEVNAKYIRTPLFAWQSKFDADQLSSSLDPPCAAAACALPYAKHLRAAVLKGLFGATVDGQRPHLDASNPQRPAHGAFLGGCLRHCNWLPKGGRIDRIRQDGLTPFEALARWYAGTAAATAAKSVALPAWLTEQDTSQFPCHNCC